MKLRMIYWLTAILLFLLAPLYSPFAPVCTGLNVFGACLGYESNILNDVLHLLLFFIAIFLAYLGYKAKGKKA